MQFGILRVNSIQSLESGRPSIFRPSFVDCQLPNDELAVLGENGETIESGLSGICNLIDTFVLIFFDAQLCTGNFASCETSR